jgi:hypothetical protein
MIGAGAKHTGGVTEHARGDKTSLAAVLDAPWSGGCQRRPKRYLTERKTGPRPDLRQTQALASSQCWRSAAVRASTRRTVALTRIRPSPTTRNSMTPRRPTTASRSGAWSGHESEATAMERELRHGHPHRPPSRGPRTRGSRTASLQRTFGEGYVEGGNHIPDADDEVSPKRAGEPRNADVGRPPEPQTDAEGTDAPHSGHVRESEEARANTRDAPEPRQRRKEGSKQQCDNEAHSELTAPRTRPLLHADTMHRACRRSRVWLARRCEPVLIARQTVRVSRGAGRRATHLALVRQDLRAKPGRRRRSS